jgi:hypothetical protein
LERDAQDTLGHSFERRRVSIIFAASYTPNIQSAMRIFKYHRRLLPPIKFQHVLIQTDTSFEDCRVGQEFLKKGHGIRQWTDILAGNLQYQACIHYGYLNGGWSHVFRILSPR